MRARAPNEVKSIDAKSSDECRREYQDDDDECRRVAGPDAAESEGVEARKTAMRRERGKKAKCQRK